jgi:ribonuclease Z
MEQAFLVLNLPTVAHLDELVASIPYSLVAPGTLPSASLRTIFYFLGPGILQDPRLGDYIRSFSTHVDLQHRISSPDFQGSNEVTFVPSALLSLRLSLLDAKIFNLPSYNFPNPTSSTSSLSTFGTNVTRLSSNDRFKSDSSAMPPTIAPRNFNFPVPSPEATLEASRLKGVERRPALLLKAEQAWSTYEPLAASTRIAVEEESVLRSIGRDVEVGDDLSVTPLGTGSAIPSKYRNVSSTLLHLPEGGYVLLDCGEGTWGQLARRFGEGVEEVLRGLEMVFISHMHQDHHAGLATVLGQRSRVRPSSCLELLRI